MRAREQITALISSLTCPTAFRFPIEMIVFFRMMLFSSFVKYILYVIYIVEHFIQLSLAIWKSRIFYFILIYLFLILIFEESNYIYMIWYKCYI